MKIFFFGILFCLLFVAETNGQPWHAGKFVHDEWSNKLSKHPKTVFLRVEVYDSQSLAPIPRARIKAQGRFNLKSSDGRVATSHQNEYNLECRANDDGVGIIALRWLKSSHDYRTGIEIDEIEKVQKIIVSNANHKYSVVEFNVGASENFDDDSWGKDIIESWWERWTYYESWRKGKKYMNITNLVALNGASKLENKASTECTDDFVFEKVRDKRYDHIYPNMNIAFDGDVIGTFFVVNIKAYLDPVGNTVIVNAGKSHVNATTHKKQSKSLDFYREEAIKRYNQKDYVGTIEILEEAQDYTTDNDEKKEIEKAIIDVRELVDDNQRSHNEQNKSSSKTIDELEAEVQDLKKEVEELKIELKRNNRQTIPEDNQPDNSKLSYENSTSSKKTHSHIEVDKIEDKSTTEIWRDDFNYPDYTKQNWYPDGNARIDGQNNRTFSNNQLELKADDTDGVPSFVYKEFEWFPQMTFRVSFNTSGSSLDGMNRLIFSLRAGPSMDAPERKIIVVNEEGAILGANNNPICKDKPGGGSFTITYEKLVDNNIMFRYWQNSLFITEQIVNALPSEENYNYISLGTEQGWARFYSIIIRK